VPRRSSRENLFFRQPLPVLFPVLEASRYAPAVRRLRLQWETWAGISPQRMAGE
jgi:hypothetical protein